MAFSELVSERIKFNLLINIKIKIFFKNRESKMDFSEQVSEGDNNFQIYFEH